MRENLDELSKGELIALVRQMQVVISSLESEISRLKKDSSTSSKPPSSDIVKPKPKDPSGKVKKRRRVVADNLGTPNKPERCFRAKRLTTRMSMF